MQIFKSREARIILTVYVLLLLLPKATSMIGWTPSIEFDWEGFYLGWYQTLIDIGKLLFGFALVNIIWENYKKHLQENEKKVRFDRFRDNWQKQCGAVLADLEELLESIQTNDRKRYERTKMSFFRQQTLLSYLAATGHANMDSCVNNHQDALIIDFSKTISGSVDAILKSLDGGSLIPGRQISLEDQSNIQKLKSYLLEVSTEFNSD
jgi:hypothetical protein